MASVERRLAAIVSADVVGYTRLMEADEAGTHARLKARFTELVEPKIAEHGKCVRKTSARGTPRKNTAVPENRRFVTNYQRRHYPVCLRLMKPNPTRPRSDESQEVWNRIGPSAFAR